MITHNQGLVFTCFAQKISMDMLPPMITIKTIEEPNKEDDFLI